MTNPQVRSPTIKGDESSRRGNFLPRSLKTRLLIITTFSGITILALWFFGTLSIRQPRTRVPYPGRPPHQPSKLEISLPGYGSFQGVQIPSGVEVGKASSTLVDAWLGIEYSTQPVGQNRFRPVTWPATFEGVRNANASGPACWQNVYGSQKQAEECLTVNIYRPSEIPFEQKLPALVYLHGGSFVMGSHNSFDGPIFVGMSAQPLMVVTVQYRLGVLGSLPSTFMASRGLLNLGVRDQRMALEFLQRYISYFGGDPARITVGGQSAGAHSVGIHLFHDYGETNPKPLFHQAILSSGSPTARAFPSVDYPLYQGQVDHFMDYVNCPSSPASTALQCLRAAEVDDIQFISSSLYNAHNYNITWPWQPVSPGALLEKRGSQSGQDRTFFKVPILISSTTDEGKAFAPQDLRFDEEFEQFWKTLSPGLTDQDLKDLEKLYPPNVTGSIKPAAYVSSQFERISAAYGDFSYICPVQDTAGLLANSNVSVFKARFNTPNWAPAYMGVPHASDAAYFNGRPGTQFPVIGDIYAAYWASFVVSGDPNHYRREGSTVWEKYEGIGGRQLVVNKPEDGGPKMEDEQTGIRMKQCAWWRDSQRASRLNK